MAALACQDRPPIRLRGRPSPGRAVTSAQRPRASPGDAEFCSGPRESYFLGGKLAPLERGKRASEGLGRNAVAAVSGPAGPVQCEARCLPRPRSGRI
jgi:hypothetical protein